MAQLTGVFRIGQDPELRYAANGTANLSLSLAYNYGYGDRKGTQWIRGTLFGKQAESLQPYLTRGGQIYAVIDDPKVDEYEKKDGTSGVSFVGIIQKVELIGGKPAEQQQEAPRRAAPKPKAAQPEFDDDSIPF